MPDMALTERAEIVAAQLQKMADMEARKMTAGHNVVEIRSAQADALSDLAKVVAALSRAVEGWK